MFDFERATANKTGKLKHEIHVLKQKCVHPERYAFTRDYDLQNA